MAKAITKGQLQGSLECVEDCLAQTARSAAEAVLEMGNALSAPMTGATTNKAGTSGMVPAPAAGETEKFLRSDGTWSGLAETVFVVSTSTQIGNVLWIKPTDE